MSPKYFLQFYISSTNVLRVKLKLILRAIDYLSRKFQKFLFSRQQEKLIILKSLRKRSLFLSNKTVYRHYRTLINNFQLIFSRTYNVSYTLKRSTCLDLANTTYLIKRKTHGCHRVRIRTNKSTQIIRFHSAQVMIEALSI